MADTTILKTEDKPKSKTWFKNTYIRYISQFAFMFTMLSLIFGRYGYPVKLSGEIHNYCPFGGVEALANLVPSGVFTRGTGATNLVMLGGVLLSILVFGGAFCGWVCPLGTIFEWLYKLRAKIWKKRIELPRSVHNVLRYSKYLVLVLVIIATHATSRLAFEHFDPYYASFTLGRGGITLGIIILAIFALAGLFVERFFCLYLCPLSGVIVPFAKLSATGIVRNCDKCVDCGTCDSVCPERIPISKQTKIDRGNCIQCLSCIDNCPNGGDCLEFKLGW